MIRNLLLTLGIVIINISTSFAYENFEKGYVILHTQDTIFGLIDNQMWEDSPTKINFRKSLNDPIIQYTAKEILFFFLDKNANLYFGSDLKYRLTYNPTSTRLVQDVAHMEVKPFSGFLSVLILGKINLLKISYNAVDYFFTQTENQSPVQLELRTVTQEVDGTTLTKTLHLYRNHLHLLSKDYPNLQIKVSTINYGEKSFISFVRDYNQHFNSLTYKVKESAKFYTSAGLTANLFSTNFKIKDIDISYGSNLIEVNALSPSLGVYFIVYQNKGQGKWGLFNELTYKMLHKDLSYRYNQGVFAYDADTQIRLNLVKYSFGIRVSSTKAKKYNFFGQGGLYISHTFSTPEVERHVVRDSDLFPLTDKNVSTLAHTGYFAGVGLRIMNIETEARAEMNRIGSGTPMTGYGIVIRWRLTKQ